MADTDERCGAPCDSQFPPAGFRCEREPLHEGAHRASCWVWSSEDGVSPLQAAYDALTAQLAAVSADNRLLSAERDRAVEERDAARAQAVALAKGELRTFKSRAADALADEVAVLVRRRVIDPRSPAGDALLSYRDPPSTAPPAAPSSRPSRRCGRSRRRRRPTSTPSSRASPRRCDRTSRERC